MFCLLVCLTSYCSKHLRIWEWEHYLTCATEAHVLKNNELQCQTCWYGHDLQDILSKEFWYAVQSLWNGLLQPDAVLVTKILILFCCLFTSLSFPSLLLPSCPCMLFRVLIWFVLNGKNVFSWWMLLTWKFCLPLRPVGKVTQISSVKFEYKDCTINH